MKLKKIAQIVGISFGIMMLAACSHMKKNNTGYDTTGMNAVNTSGAATSGLGQNENYGDEAGASARGVASKRVYYFDYDKYVVREEDRPAILANADYLVAHPNVRIILEGHTDPRGSREYNIALGEHRANAVLELMKGRGVNPSQVRVVSYGAERPAVPGHTEQDFQLDRRVVIVKLH